MRYQKGCKIFYFFKFSKRSNKAAQGDKSLTVDVDMMIVGGVYQDGVAPV